MYKIATLNNISQAGLDLLTEDYMVVDDLKEAHGIIVRSHPLHDMEFPPNLLTIARAGAGVNNIPLDRCAEEGIVVFNTPGSNANAVKELVLAGLLLSARNIPEAMSWARGLVGTTGVSKAVEKAKNQFVGTELKGKTLGVIGLGSIGVRVANAADDLGMNVIGYDPYLTIEAALGLSDNIELVDSPNDLYPKCDYITIHVPASEETKEMINSEAFRRMKKGIVLLNFSRDNLVNDADLTKALASGKLHQYITDFPNDEVIGMDKVIAIPHLGASTEEAEANSASMAVHQIMDYVENGNISNSVNFPACNLGTIAKGTTRVCIINRNVPAILGKIASSFSEMGLNIENMLNRSKGNYSYTLVEVLQHLDGGKIQKQLDVEQVISMRILEG